MTPRDLPAAVAAVGVALWLALAGPPPAAQAETSPNPAPTTASAPAFTASLWPTARPDPSVRPWYAARLRVDNRSGQVIRQLRVRWARGGPTFVLSASIPPDTTQELPLFLPAENDRERYVVEAFLGATSPQQRSLGTVETTLTFPAGRVDGYSLWVDPDPYVRFYESDLPLWQQPQRWGAVGLAAAVVIALAAVTLIPRPGIRLAAVVLIATGGTVVALGYVRAQDTLIVREIPAADASAGPPYDHVVVTCRRTQTWTTPRTDLVPVYQYDRDMTNERMRIHVGEGTSLPVQPSRAYLFRLRARHSSAP